MTLKQVAKEAGVSESLVSQIERNKVSPAIDTLFALADVLDINLEYLFEEYRRTRPVTIIRAEERRTMQDEEILYEEIACPQNEEENHSVESYIVTLPAGTHTHRGSYGHIGREIGIILEGKARLHYASCTYDLDTGDSVNFRAGEPHTLENTGKCPLKAVWFVTPAQRFVE